MPCVRAEVELCYRKRGSCVAPAANAAPDFNLNARVRIDVRLELLPRATRVLANASSAPVSGLPMFLSNSYTNRLWSPSSSGATVNKLSEYITGVPAGGITGANPAG